MKKTIAIVLCLLLTLSMTACGAAPQETTPPQPTETEYTGFRVPSPMAWPDYSFDHTPTTDELRQMAVKAMRDMLSVQWCTETEIRYQKAGAVSGKDFRHVPETVYAGMPYTNAATGIVHWFQYYEPTTGRLIFTGKGSMINSILGNSCAACVSWGWLSVCKSLKTVCITEEFVPANGAIPVGPFKMPMDIKSLQEYTTGQIVKDNGKDIMFQSYAQVLPADVLTSEEANHAIMAIEKAHVEYNADGKINGNKSYIMIQDQRGGKGDGFYEVEENGSILHYSGRTSHKYTFTYLLDNCYVPFTTAEFLGQVPYEKAKVTFQGSMADLDSVVKGSIVSNFPICTVKVALKDQVGNETVLKNGLLFSGDIESGKAMKYPMSDCKSVLGSTLKKKLEAGKDYTLLVQVTLSTGEIFEMVKLNLKG